MKKILTIIFFTAAVLAPAARAATITVIPPDARNRVLIQLDTQGQAINAVEAHFSFDPRAFSIASISDGGSIINLWLTKPGFSNTSGTLDLSGIVPGGIVTGDGLLVAVTLDPVAGGTSKGFALTGARALLNDGRGTAAKLSFIGAPFSLDSISSTIAIDTQAPDSFTPEIGSDPNIFGGKYFLAFAATDQHSGIDRYEVMEGPGGIWRPAVSPYLLNDQSLAGDIYVRAIDIAGNFRLEKVTALHPGPVSREAQRSMPFIIGFAILLVTALGILFRWRKAKKR